MEKSPTIIRLSCKENNLECPYITGSLLDKNPANIGPFCKRDAKKMEA